jgi:hypothetical protein
MGRAEDLRGGAAATGRAEDLGGDGKRRRRGGRQNLVEMGSGADGKGGGGERVVAKSLQAKQYMVSSLARVRVRAQHMERGVS